MKKTEYLLNLAGQIRIYSLVELIVICIAIKADWFSFAGIILLHLGFLLYLESVHKHKYRAGFPKYLWIGLICAGIVFYNNPAVIGFLVFSFLYAKKNIRCLSPYSPLFRGVQCYFLISGVIGFLSPLSFVFLGISAVRNFIGDLRDVTKDRKEGLKTLPIVLGFKKDMKRAHLIALLFTTLAWWYLSGISVLWLVALYLVQIGSYDLTPR